MRGSTKRELARSGKGAADHSFWLAGNSTIFYGSSANYVLFQVSPVIASASALQKSAMEATLTLAGKDNDKLILSYPAVKTGTGYSAPTILLEFGARATGEPHQFCSVACDIAPAIDGLVSQLRNLW